MYNKILCIVPHLDDEVLSFGSLLLNYSKLGADIKMVYLVAGGVHKLQNLNDRLNEMHSVCNKLNISNDSIEVLYTNLDAMMDTIDLRSTASRIDKITDEYKPDLLLTTLPSNHQDHMHLYNAIRISLRMKDGFVVPNVLFGEYPFLLSECNSPFNGKVYHKMTKSDLDEKIELFELYKSQVRPKPSPLGSDGIRILAESRGLESGLGLAECYYNYRTLI